MTDTGGGTDADGESLVPTFVAQPSCVAQAKKKLIGNHQAFDQASAVGACCFGDRKKSAQAIAGMPAGVLVIEIEIANHRCVDESRALCSRFLTVTDDSTRKAFRDGAARQTHAHPRRLAVVRRDGAGQAIDKKSGCGGS